MRAAVVVSRLVPVALLLLSLAMGTAAAQGLGLVQSRFFVTTDGVRLHYLEAGPPAAHCLIFVPGWTMPAWIWTPQIAAFSRAYHVIAFDPRGQGESEAPSFGYDQSRRGEDIADLIAQLGGRAIVATRRPLPPVVIVGWSLGVLDTLAYVHRHGDGFVAGLVLVDNSVGEEPAPTYVPPRPRHGPPPSHVIAMRRFVQGMFRRPQPAGYLERLALATLHTPEFASRALLSYPVPRSYWRDAIYATRRPVLYVVRPGFAAQAENLERNRPDTETAVFADAGHALFVDDAGRFDGLMADFLRRRIWP